MDESDLVQRDSYHPASQLRKAMTSQSLIPHLREARQSPPADPAIPSHEHLSDILLLLVEMKYGRDSPRDNQSAGLLVASALRKQGMVLTSVDRSCVS